MAATQEDLAGNGGPARQYDTFSLTAATRLDNGTTARQYNAATPQDASSCSFKRWQRRDTAGSSDTARRGKMARQHSKKVLAARRRRYDETARWNGKTATTWQDGDNHGKTATA
jgi:hypothetical protein